MSRVLNTSLKNKLQNLKKIIDGANSIVLSGHYNPDGDCLASSLALAEYLQSIGKKFVITGDEAFPESYAFLPDTQFYRPIQECDLKSDDFDTAIIVDCGDFTRIGKLHDIIDSRHTLVNIDHHISNSKYGKVNIIVERASSVGEIIYYFFKVNKIKLTYNMAVDIYISLVTDTGSFRYDSMHPEVHEIASELLKLGVRPMEFNVHLYQDKKLAFLKLLSTALSRLELSENGRIAFSYLVYDDFLAAGDDDTEGIIEHLGMIKTVSVYILVKEREKGTYSASLRSKFEVDVTFIAKEFGGGGHKRASGCRTRNMPLTDFRNSLINLTAKQL